MFAVARAVDEDRIMHAYRRRNRIILFDEVDINTRSRLRLRARRS